MSQRPWSDRHPNLSGALILAVLGLIVLGIIFAWVTRITIPLLILLVPVLTSAWLTYTGIRCEQAQRQRERQAERQRQRQQTQQPAPIGVVLSGDYDTLIGDGDRNAVLELLTERFVGGYLDQAMYEERSDIALQARRRGELIPAVLDLPQ